MNRVSNLKTESLGSSTGLTKSMAAVCLALIVMVALAGCSETDEAKKSAAGKSPTNVSEPFKKITTPTPGFDVFSENLFKKKFDSSPGSQATTRFAKVTDSGIQFTNTLPRDNPNRLAETGSGVAIADYDGDGEVDVYLLAVDGPNKLFRGLGDFKFEDVTEAAGVDGSVGNKDAWAAGASFADVDNDGDLDLFVGNMTSTDILYINQGDGTFKDEGFKRGLKNEGPSKAGSFCDYDLDGDLDLYLVTYRNTEDSRKAKTVNVFDRTHIHPDYRDIFGFVDRRTVKAGQRDFLYRNDGNGMFSDVTTDAKVMDHGMGFSASWLDYDDDGLPDIYVANDTWQSDRLLRNKGDGTFKDVLPDVARHSPRFAMGSDSGDLNNDGLVDLMVGEVSGSSNFRQKLGSGDIEDSAWFLEHGSPRQCMRNAIYINSGVDSFMEVAFMTGMSSTNWTWATRLADLNNDGLLDVFVTNGNARDSRNADIARKLSRLEGDQLNKAKLLASKKKVPALREKNVAFMNTGNLNFQDMSQQWGLDLEGVSHGAAFADIDHDGDLDIVVNNFYEPATIYRNESTEGNRLTIALRSEHSNSFGFGSKVETWSGAGHQVKHLTPVRGYLSSDEPIVHFGLGDSSTVERLKITWPGGHVQEFKNLEAGYQYLAVESEPGDSTEMTPSVTAEQNTAFTEPESGLVVGFTHHDKGSDDLARQPLLPYRTSRMGPGVAFGDINNDGLPDVFVGNGNDLPGSLFVNRGATLFEEIQGPWGKHFFPDDHGALFFDADGDGDQDLLVTSGGTEYKLGHENLRDRLYLNQQGEVFVHDEKAIPKASVSSSTAAAIDFDHDGDLDLVIGSRSIPHKYPNASQSRLLRNDGGKFVDLGWKAAKPLTKTGIVNSILGSDFNNDGWTDLIVATEWGPVRFLKNSKGKFNDVTEELGVANRTGWWRGLAAGDFDSDGDLDYVATNQGLNTKYHADAAHPHRLYFGDFDQNGRVDLIESMYEGDTEYPVRGLSRSSSAMPFVGEKFKTFESFALAPLAEIYDLDKAEHDFKEVNYLQSAIFWNDGGSMRIEPLPRMAQTSPGFGVETLDYDCDGDIDILIANNFFGAEPETGYMDGGHGALLVNDGSGKFDFVWPNKSGIVLQDDSMGLAVDDLDFDGDLDAVVGVHAEKARTFVNQANPESWWKLAIVGPSGNAGSIGAQATVTRQDGSKQLHEVRAGGSYLSQSSGAIFLYASEANPIKKIEVRWPTGEVGTIEEGELEEVGEISIDAGDWAELPESLGD